MRMISKCSVVVRITAALSLAALVTARPAGPCDIYAAAHTPCVAAHSMVRALYVAYSGPLYSLLRDSDNATKVVGVNQATGFADAHTQRSFCPATTKCTVERIFDQSPQGNHLDKVLIDPHHNPHKQPVSGIDAMKEQVMVGGHSVYSAFFQGGQSTGVGTQGFRAQHTQGVAQGDEPESMYAVVSGTHFNGRCCFDYGNAEGNHGESEHPFDSSSKPDPSDGKMEAIAFQEKSPHGGTWSDGIGDGPWVMGDLEEGVWAGDKRGTHAHPAVNVKNTPINTTFVTAMLKGRKAGWSLKHGDAQQGQLTTLFDGPRPQGYKTMKKQGAIVLGIGGDGSNYGVGTFYEGAMTANYTTDATDKAVQANIVAAGYGRGANVIV